MNGDVIFLGPCSIPDAADKFRHYREGLDEGGWDDGLKAQRLRHSMVHHEVVVGETDGEAWDAVEARMAFNPMMRRANDPRPLRKMYEDGLAKRSGLMEDEAHNSEVALGRYMGGSPDTLVDLFRQHEAVGIEQVHTRFNAGTWNPEGWDRSFRLFVDEVMPRIDASTLPAPQG